MTLERLWLEVLERGVQLWVADGDLCFKAPEGALTPDLRRQLRQGKAELVRRLEEGQRYAAASFDQQRLWTIEQLQPRGSAYSTAGAFHLHGPLDVAALDAALQELVHRHEVLRTRLIAVGGRPVQMIVPSDVGQGLRLPVVDLSALESNASAAARALVKAEHHRALDLRSTELFRTLLLRLGAKDWLLFLRLHHAISDGASEAVLYRELSELYANRAQHRPDRLPKLPLQYADFAAWQRRRLDEETLALLLNRSRQPLEALEPLELPSDFPRPTSATFRAETQELRLPLELATALEKQARDAGASLYMVLLAAGIAWFYRLSGQRDFAVGSPITGRGQEGLEDLIGLFVNMLALRADLATESGSADLDFATLLKRVRETVLRAFAHQELPFDHLVAELTPDRDLARHPLFQVSVALHPEPRTTLELPGLAVRPHRLTTPKVQLDLELHLWRTDAGLVGEILYSSDLFCATTLARWSQHLKALLGATLAEPLRPLDQLSLWTRSQQHQLLVEWNDSACEFGLESSSDSGLHRLLERQATRTPDREALLWQEPGGRPATLSYRQLDEQADRLAVILRSLGVSAEQRVGLFLDRGPAQVVALLAVLKAGGAYLPLEPSLPFRRLADLIRDSRPTVVLTTEAWQSRLPEVQGQVIHLSPEGRPPGVALASEPLMGTDDVAASQTAYLLYTSGSTGRPKGAAISHAAIDHHMRWMQKAMPLVGRDRVIQKTPFSFDASVWEFWAPWQVGAALVLAPADSHRDPPRLLRFLSQQRGTILQVVPSLLRVLLDDPHWPLCRHLRRVVCGGEALATDLLQAFSRPKAAQAGLEEPPLYNAYGPTEATIHATVQPLSRVGGSSKFETGRTMAIGRPIANTRVLVAGRGLRPVPPGVAGELWVSGVGLTRGYLDRPRRTAERFVPQSLGLHAGERLYRTGDRVRHLVDGRLLFLGRIDHQVKIRGHRVELGEIEAELRRHPAVRDAVVVAPGPVGRSSPGQTTHLVAYFVSIQKAGESRAPSSRHLQAFLSQRLLEPMVPSIFVALDALPRSPAGKIDRRALTRQASTIVRPSDSETVFEAPRTPIEESIAEIWAHLLGIDRIGVQESFFELGGHSLLAIQTLSRIRKSFGVEIEVRVLFEQPTVAGLASRVEQQLRQQTAKSGVADPQDEASGVETMDVERQNSAPQIRSLENPESTSDAPFSSAPLSFAQRRLWFLAQLEPASTAYHMLTALELVGPLEVQALQVSLGEVVRRHQVLRTTFFQRQGRPQQRLRHPPRQVLSYLDLSCLGEPAAQQNAMKIARQEARWPFDLERGPLLRARLLRLAEDRHLLVLCLHHIVFDGWSQGILYRELTTLYACAVAGEPSRLPALQLQYADFATWQRQQLTGASLERRLATWRRRLVDWPALELRGDRPRPADPGQVGAGQDLALEPALLAALRRLSIDRGASLYMVLLAGFAVLLHRLTDQRELVVGSPVANRGYEDVEALIGFFVNLLPMRLAITEADASFAEMLSEVRKTALHAYAHQDLPFELLVEELTDDRETQRHPLFQVSLGLHNASEAGLELAGVRSCPVRLDIRGVRLDLELHFWPSREPSGEQSEEVLNGRWIYDADLFDATTIARWSQHLAELLRAAVNAPEMPWARLPTMSRTQRHQLRLEWNGRRPELTGEVLHRRFEAQVDRTPERVALFWQSEALSYRQLNERAEALALALEARGVGPEVTVALWIDRGVGRVVAMLAVLKAGGAYCPLDPALPTRRLADLLEDSGAALVVARRGQESSLPSGSPLVVSLRSDGSLMETTACSPSRRPKSVRGDNTAYVLYTSGSTGQARGVAISHRAIVHHMAWMQGELPLDAADRLLQKTPVGFDASIWEFWAPLEVGASLVLTRPGDHRDSERLVQILREQRITILQVVPSLLHMLEEAPDFGHCQTVRRVLCGGEELSPARVEQFFTHGPPAELYNVYGPTEATIHASFERCRAAESFTIPIGRPVTHGRLAVIDRRSRPVLIGAVGELHIAGAGLMRGYLGQPSRTAEVLIPEDVCGVEGRPGERRYRTGDLARHRLDGRLEYLGRIDHQVKIRGHRIEPGEIEAALMRHPEIRVAVVVPARDTQQLAAYLLPEATSDLSATLLTGRLRKELSERLPAYMVPAVWRVLETLPLTNSGKVDRRSLSNQAHPSSTLTVRHVPPRSPMEKALAQIWEQVLGCEQVGVHDNFFRLGGHSLLATQVMSRIRRVFSCHLALRVLFEHPTVAGLGMRLAAVLQDPNGTEPVRPALQPVGRDQPLPLSFAQRRLWFLDRLEPESNAYHMPTLLRLQGPLDDAALLRSWYQIVCRHEILRTVFPSLAGRPQQVILSVNSARGIPQLPVLTRVDLSRLSSDSGRAQARRWAAANATRPFDLAGGPLLRGQLLRLSAEEHLLLLCFHHIVSDAWSHDVFLHELSALYSANSQADAHPVELPELPIQYADYAVGQRQWLRGEVLDGMISYWRRQLVDLPAEPLTADRPETRLAPTARSAVRSLEIDRDLSDALRQLSFEAGTSLFMTLFAGFAALLGRLTQAQDLLVGTPAANRGAEEVEGLIGLFVNTLVLRADLESDPSFQALLRRVRNTALEAYAHQDLPFEKLVEELQPDRDLGRNPIFQVFFNVLQEGPQVEAHPWGEIRVEPWQSGASVELSTSKFDLNLIASERAGGIRLYLIFRPERFDISRMERMLRQQAVLLRQAAHDPERSISRLPILSRVERHQLTREWSHTPRPPTFGGTVEDEGLLGSIHDGLHQHFQRRARHAPDTIAVVFAARAAGEGFESGLVCQQLTYGDLSRRVRRLADRLRQHGVAPEGPVGVCFERSPEMVIAVLAVLRAGGAYVPFDATFPPARLTFLLEDSGARVLLTRPWLRDLFTGYPGEILSLDAQGEIVDTAPVGTKPVSSDDKLSRGDFSGSEQDLLPHQAAYVVYTSGSTGKPKGATGSHRGALAYLDWMIRRYGLSADDVVLQLAPLSFDMSVRDFFGPLVSGARAVLVAEATFAEPEALLATLAEQRISFIPGIVPTALSRMLDRIAAHPGSAKAFEWVRLLLTSGDRLTFEDCLRSATVLRRQAQLINQYGTTESYGTASGDALTPAAARVRIAFRQGDRAPSYSGDALIGRPVAHASTFALDAHLEPVATGVSGHLHVDTASLVRGYLHRPELTAERFIPNPLSAKPGARLYRTGDRVRHRSDGQLQFRGRFDHQMQLRGQRVEPGEIEAVLRRHPAVSEAVVVALDSAGGRRDAQILAAYFTVLPETATASARHLRRFVARELPRSMVPAHWTQLDRLPRTHTGKIDRRSLPAPEPRSAVSPAESRRVSASPIEDLVAGLWTDLLGLEQVGPHDNFFQLGGHSLLATQLLARVHRITGVEIPLRNLFEYPTVAQLAAGIEEGLSRSADPTPSSRSPSTISAVVRRPAQTFPLSHPQQRLWFLDRLEPGSSRYNLPAAWDLRGPLDVSALKEALAELVTRHEILRTTFPSRGGEARQCIAPTAEVGLPIVDLTVLSVETRDTTAREIGRDHALRSFDLAQGPLLRIALLRLTDHSAILEVPDYRLLLNVHHIVTDGWSQGIFYRELSIFYAAFVQRQASPLESLPIQYADFSTWQRQQLTKEPLKVQLVDWRQRLSGLSELPLPIDRPRSHQASGRAGIHGFRLSPETVRALRELGLKAGASLYMVLLTAWKTLLHRRTGQADIAVGSPIANRRVHELETLIGFFVNTLVLRTDLSTDPSFLEALSAVRETCLTAFAQQDVPFERLVEELQPGREPGRAPLIQVMFVLQNAPFEALKLGDLQLEPVATEIPGARFDLELSMVTDGEALIGQLRYDLALFDRSTLRRLAQHFQAWIASLVSSSDRDKTRVSELRMLNAVERHALQVEWNDAPARSPAVAEPASLPQLFDRQVHRAPDTVAVSCDGWQISYRQLDLQSTRLAHRLRSLGAGPEIRVGIDAELSPEFLIGVLAILKAGAAYVPLDLTLPLERLRYLIRDAGIVVLLCRTTPDQALHSDKTLSVLTDLAAGGTSASPSIPAPPSISVSLSGLAYVMYTSGSTGRPKGVGISHQAVVRLVRGQSFARLDAGETFLMFAPTSFDASTLEIWGSLLNGGRLVIPAQTSEGAKSTLLELGQILQRERVSTLWLTAGLFHLIAQDQPEDFRNLRQLLAGGDVLSPSWLRRALEAMADGILINGYGPTENTTFTCCHPLRHSQQVEAQIPIGRPIAGSRVVVLGDRLTVAAIGSEGELATGGLGLARGYLDRPRRTALSFIPDPFEGHPGERLYLTGDLARRQHDGTIDFFGRRDRQIKIRGFRVEPGEIEDRLCRHPVIRGAAVIVTADVGTSASRRLVAFWVTNERQQGVSPPTPGELRSFLAKVLPEVMLPAAFYELEALPVLATGKVDRGQLIRLAEERSARPASPPQVDSELENSSAPRTPVEEILVESWAALLGLEQVGIHENFFELGGHSLLAAQMMSRLRRSFGRALPLRALFERPTIAQFAEFLQPEARSTGHSERPPIEPASRDRLLPLSFAQQRLWFFHQLEPKSPVYHITLARRFEGLLDVPALEGALREIVRRHEILRTTFPASDGQPHQEVAGLESPQGALTRQLPGVDLSHLPAVQRQRQARELLSAEAGRAFELAREPPLRTLLVRLAADDHVLLILFHHIACDGWSLGIFDRELAELYRPPWAELGGGQVDHSTGAELTVQYADFAIWQRAWLRGAALETQLAYWQRRLENLPTLDLATDRPRLRRLDPEGAGRRGSSASFQLTPELTRTLKGLSLEAGVSLYMTLLASFMTLLYRLTGQRDLAIGSPIANRQRQELEALIGFFVNTLVLRGDLSASAAGPLTFRRLLRRVRVLCLEAYDHQDLPFEKLVQTLDPERDPARSPLFQVMFAVHNTPGQGLQMVGVKTSTFELDATYPHFDLNVSAVEIEGGLYGRVSYDADLFDRTTVTRLVRSYALLLNALEEGSERSLDELPMLTRVGSHQLLQEWSDSGWNDTVASVAEDSMSAFQVQVRRRPDAVAATDDKSHLSYAELDAQAERIADRFVASGVAREKSGEAIVALLAHRQLGFLTTVLGIFKAGAAYLPLDPQQPPRRLAQVLDRAAPRCVVVSEPLAEVLKQALSAGSHRRVSVLQLEALLAAPTRPEAKRAAPCRDPFDPEGLAYVIFTSGSTGVPKGAMVSHRGMSNHLLAKVEDLDLNEDDVVAQTASQSFDISVWQLLAPLLVGGRVDIVPQDAAYDPRHLLQRVTSSRASLLETVPSFLSVLLDEISQVAAARLEGYRFPLQNLRWLMPTGEALPPALVRRWRSACPTVPLINAYGPTECSDDVTHHVMTGNDWPTLNLPVAIGRPVRRLRVNPLHRNLDLVPVAAPGELCVAGSGVGRGYLGEPERTAPVFVPDPHGHWPGGRLYRTGDLGRRLPNGELVFLRRIDHQIKIRGFRIELGDIESTLLEHPGVGEAAVLLVENSSESQLIAYVASSPSKTQKESSALRDHLSARLPGYMVPTRIVALDTLPRLASGKVDRFALERLPLPVAPQSPIAAPSSSYDRRLLATWQEVLGRDDFGMDGNFFDLGGHSLLGIRLMAQVERRFAVRLPLATLFAQPTVQAMARQLEAEFRPDGVFESVGRPASQPLVELQAGHDSESPFFCIHPVGGHVACYLDLARHLGPDRPFYGLQATGDRESTLIEMAERYVASVRTRQSTGPYFLGGWSTGGVIAYEMARQLRAQDEDVALLVLIDPATPGHKTTNSEKGRDFYTFARVVGLEDRALLSSEEFAELAIDMALQRLLLALQRQESPAATLEFDQLRRLHRVVHTNQQAVAEYRPRAYDGRVLRLQSEAASSARRITDGSDVWDDLAPKLERLMVPGNHDTMIQEPHVEILARFLRQRLSSH